MEITPRTALRWAAAAWLGTGIYFPLQVVVARAWPRPYSFIANTISDLGVTSCDVPSTARGVDALVCSPLHDAMNGGFVAFGVMTVAGAALMARALHRSRLNAVALGCIVVVGAGGVVVGFAPSDVSPELHKAAALLRVPGVLAMALVGVSLREPRPRLAALSFGAAATSLAGMAWFVSPASAGWAGAAERLALDPFTIWAMAIGVGLAAQPSGIVDD